MHKCHVTKFLFYQLRREWVLLLPYMSYMELARVQIWHPTKLTVHKNSRNGLWSYFPSTTMRKICAVYGTILPNILKSSLFRLFFPCKNECGKVWVGAPIPALLRSQILPQFVTWASCGFFHHIIMYGWLHLTLAEKYNIFFFAI